MNLSAASVSGADLTELDLRQFSLPIYSSKKEEANGITTDARKFPALIISHDGIPVSLAGHNGSSSAAFTNLYDWVSRQGQSAWNSKLMLLMATFPRIPPFLPVSSANPRFPRPFRQK